MGTIVRLASIALTLSSASLVAAAAPERIWVVAPAALDPAALIPESVKEDCRLPMRLGNNAAHYVNEQFRVSRGVAYKTSDLKFAADGRAVTFTILAVYGEGETAWTSERTIAARVDLFERGRLVDSRVVREYAVWGGVRGTFGSACQMYERTTRKVAKRAAQWIAQWIAAGAFASALPPRESQLAIEGPAALDQNLSVSQAIQYQCPPQGLTSMHVFERVSTGFAGVRAIRVGEASTGKVLRLSITEVEGIRAGGVAGGKVIGVRAEVLDDGRVLASREFGGAGTSPAPGPCTLLEGAAVDVGKQIAAWLPKAAGIMPRRVALSDTPGEGDADEK